MEKYYTRACNFYYGNHSKYKLKKKASIPLNGNNLISFDTVEILSRNSKKVVHLNEIKNLPNRIKIKVKKDLKNISKKKYFKTLKFKSIPLIMGVVNTTPDSFSDGGKYLKNNLAIKQINKIIKEGAEIIDIGGETSKPGSSYISPNTEWKRVEKKIKFLNKKKYYFSIDTQKKIIMEKSLKYGANLINDISGFSYDEETLNFLKISKLPFIIHHIQGTPKDMQIQPKYKNVLLDIYDYFEKKLKIIRSMNINHRNIILDPGIGFGKNMKHNITLINQISIFHSLGYPVMLGLSRKRFIKDVVKTNDSKERLGGTISSCIYSAMQGVQILRVHDVNEVKQALKIYEAIQLRQ